MGKGKETGKGKGQDNGKKRRTFRTLTRPRRTRRNAFIVGSSATGTIRAEMRVQCGFFFLKKKFVRINLNRNGKIPSRGIFF